MNVCNNDSISDSEKRSQVEDLISQLADLSPIQETAISPSLQKKWDLYVRKKINKLDDILISAQH